VVLTDAFDDVVTQEQFGDVVGIVQQAVSGLIDRGILERGGTLGEWLLGYCTHLRQEAAGRVIDPELLASRRRRESARAEAEELELARKKGAVVLSADLEIAMAARMAISRESLGAVPARCAPLVAATADMNLCEEIIAREIAGAIASIVTWPDGIRDAQERRSLYLAPRAGED